MKRYSALDEENIRMEALLRQWGRSGLLEASQVATLQSDLHTDLRRTNAFLRALLFVFTAIIVVASVYLVLLTFHVEEKSGIGIVCIVAAVVYFGLAEFLVGFSACIALELKKHSPAVRRSCWPSARR